ncbi:unnamed protein product [Oppiella nova]|uniref:Uncharacterized protein n=1 Tax=Oppiella nova TaxID=334625 RepID=A0A7R9MF83_9ACAR|nr:unnamed protein product [Oppiella nova]CAG2176286.1 unnamed protein product [Oppiella nova]
MFTQTPITFRRIKSPAEAIAKYDAFNFDDDDISLDIMSGISLKDSEDIEPKEADSEVKGQQNRVEEQTNDTITNTDPESHVQTAPHGQLTQQQQDDRSKREWEAGRIDWMGAHQSDRIIDRLKRLIND